MSGTKTMLTVNGTQQAVTADPGRRLSRVLREDLGLTGTKVGCDAGDCGACTILMDGQQVCACMVPLAQVDGQEIMTVEGLAAQPGLRALPNAFLDHGAVQCGICIPGMLMAASELLLSEDKPNETQVRDAIGGVLCRCTGYQKIVEAILAAAHGGGTPAEPDAGEAVGARVRRLDGQAKVDGSAQFGDDAPPEGSLWLKVIRSPHFSADFEIGDTDRFLSDRPGLVRVFTSADVPGSNAFGIYPDLKDQPVLAETHARFKGEAIAIVVGDRATIERLDTADFPITLTPRDPVVGSAAARAPDAPRLHDGNPGNILIKGAVRLGDVDTAISNADVSVEGHWHTTFVEHAYIEPEAGWARITEDANGASRVELTVTTQTPYMDRDETALILGIAPEQVRIIPTAVGGGFGGKLDQSIQPLLAIAAWHLRQPVSVLFHRPESLASSTKRHPTEMQASLAVSRAGHFQGYRFHGDFNTGAYASWGPTVAGRVPIHATGPYRQPAVQATTTAYYTNETPAGAFRGFGVPQASLCHEGLIDAAAARIGMDQLEIRHLNALRVGDRTSSGQLLENSAGLVQCLDALRPGWHELHQAAEHFNATGTTARQGVGIGCMWYGCGNTSMSNPSTMRVGLTADAEVTLYNGAIDIGQGTCTIMAQICADALGVPLAKIRQIGPDTDLTADAGKSSASRQTFVSGRAAELAGESLRAQILRLANAGDDAEILLEGAQVRVREGGREQNVDLADLPPRADGDVLSGVGYFDPPSEPLDEDGQGEPYAAYAYGAQIALVEVDIELGTVKVRRMIAAHDVGRAINPSLVEGQIHGGIAQGLGLALMEEYIPGRTENLHDYLIPTVGDMPEIECILIEDPNPLGPFGAKGVGEPALVATAPAIFGAIHHATGAVLHQAPALPHRVRAAILEAQNKEAAE